MPTKTPLAALIPDRKNANRGTDRGRKAVETSLKTLGAGRSVVLDRNNVIIAGNKTVEQAIAAGYVDIEIHDSDGKVLHAVRRTDLDLRRHAKAKKLAIADNRAGELGLEWDPETLAKLIDGLELDPVFFDDGELKAIIKTVEADAPTDEDELPDIPLVPVTMLGDRIHLGDHVLVCGDATSADDVASLLEGRKPRFVFTDPPYGIRVKISDGKQHGRAMAKRNTFRPIAGDDSTATAIAAYRLLASYKIGRQVWWGGNYYAEALPPSACWLVWDKLTGDNDFADGELAWTNIEGAVRIFQHRWSGLLKASEKGERRIHPTQKPVALAQWCLEKYGKPGDEVVDLFGGSGSTMLACEKTERTCLMLEMDPAYCDAIITRWEKFTGKTATRVSGEKG